MSIWTDLTGIDFSVRQVDANGISTRVLIAGEGEDVIFMYGTSGHLEAFSRNIVAHAQAGFRCHAIDALGHGYTDKPDFNYEIPLYAKHVIDYMDAQGIKKRIWRANLWAVGPAVGSRLIGQNVCSHCN